MRGKLPGGISNGCPVPSPSRSPLPALALLLRDRCHTAAQGGPARAPRRLLESPARSQLPETILPTRVTSHAALRGASRPPCAAAPPRQAPPVGLPLSAPTRRSAPSGSGCHRRLPHLRSAAALPCSPRATAAHPAGRCLG